MSKFPVKSIWLELQISPHNPQILAILDQLLLSEILTPEQISQIARNCLSENLTVAQTHQMAQVVVAPVIASEPEQIPVTPPTPTIWQTLKDELSVRWLLFLGVFLVVLSSGVLAATQWSRFPAWGQYGLLWLYTIGFWLTGSWANKQQGLKLTANTLQMAALLLIPVNFWAIDSFGLWHQPWEIATSIIATTTLARMGYLSASPRPSKSAKTQISAQQSAQWLMGTFLGLSLLQLGWQVPHWAAISIYIGSIGIALVLQKTRQIAKGTLIIYGLGILLLRGFFVVHLPVTNFSLAIGILGWLFAQWSIQYQQKRQRVENVALNNPSLRLTKQAHTLTRLIALYQRLGAGLLLLGWSLGLSEWRVSPWQSLAVDGLALIWLWQRLRREEKQVDLVLLFFVGMQTYFLSSFLWRFISSGALFAKFLPGIKLLFGENYLFAGGLLVFPYLLLWVWLTEYFWRRDQPNLCGTGEKLVMTSGLMVTSLTAINPLALLIDLAASTAILAYLTHRRTPVSKSYLNLTHLGGLLTVFAVVNYRWDWCQSIGQRLINIPIATDWYGNSLLILVVSSFGAMVLAAIELFFASRPATTSTQDLWRQSAWNFGQILAVLAAAGFFLALTTVQYVWPLWLMILPTVFTYIAVRSTRSQSVGYAESDLPWQITAQYQAQWWAIGSFISSVLLTGNQTNWRSIFLAISVVMLYPIVGKMARQPALSKDSIPDQTSVISRETIAAAMIHIGFGLGLGVNLCQDRITNSQWLLVAAVVSSGLWWISNRLHHRSNPRSVIYATAGDTWAGIITALTLIVGAKHYIYTNLQLLPKILGLVINPQTAQVVATPSWFNSLDFSILLSTTLLIWAMANRQKWPNPWAPTLWLSAAIITGQIGLGSGVHLLGGNDRALAISNVVLAGGLYCWQTFGPPKFTGKSVAGSNVLSVINNIYLPGILAVWGLILRLHFFDSYSGLLSIGSGMILVVSSYHYAAKWPAYSGLGLVTLGCYEVATYQILQAPAGGNIADALTIYGLVTALIALIYRSMVSIQARRNQAPHSQEHCWGLPVANLKAVAHAHWSIASAWQIAVALTPLTPVPQLTVLHLFTSGLLGLYALIQGRDQNRGDWWVYLGLAELMGVGIYARSIFQSLGVVDEGLILAACLTGLLVLLAPWSNWGWRDRPWRIAALTLPLLRLIFEWEYISLLNLVVLAIFYGGVARRERRFAWVYASLIFVNWAAFRLLTMYSLTAPIWYALMVGLSILVLVQWDPAWQKSRQNRHYGRLAGAGTIAVTALVWHQIWLPIILGVAIASAGLIWRIRAWLYVGTITFLLTNSYQLVVLITERPITKWAIGLFAGMLIIFLAANFEKRREQITLAVQHWLDRLQEWQ
jgi:hypothetical protein